MNNIKSIVIVIVVFVLVGLLVISDAPEKFGRLATIMGNVSTNVLNAHHGDPRSLEEMSAEHIKATTGSTKVINPNQLPKAFVPFKKYGHPPFTMGACGVCHAPKRSKPAAIVTRTVAQLCYKCHTPVEKISERMAGYDCNKCHSPHHADRKKLVRNKVIVRKCPVGEFITE